MNLIKEIKRRKKIELSIKEDSKKNESDGNSKDKIRKNRRKNRK